MFLLCLSSASLLSLFCVSSVSLFVDPLFLLCVSSASLLFLSWFPSVYPMFLYCLSSVSPLLILWFFSAAILFLLYFRSNVFSSPKVVDGERAAGLGLIVGQWTAPKGAMKDDCNFRAYPDFPPGPISPPMGRFPPPQPFFFRSIVSGKWCVGFLIDTFYDFEDGDNRNLETLAIFQDF